MSFVEIITVPYLSQKVRAAYNDWHHEGETDSKLRKILKYYPIVNLSFTVCDVVCKLMYFLKYTEFSSIPNLLLGARYTDLAKHAPLGRFTWLLEIIFPLSMFYVQFIKQWNVMDRPVYETKIVSAPRYLPPDKNDTCMICGQRFSIPTAVPTTGYVYCYVCIFKYVQKHKTCPVSKLPLDLSDLVKLNFY